MNGERCRVGEGERGGSGREEGGRERVKRQSETPVPGENRDKDVEGEIEIEGVRGAGR